MDLNQMKHYRYIFWYNWRCVLCQNRS